MKKLILLTLVSILTIGQVQAQNYRNSRYYNHHTGRLDYHQRGHGYRGDVYYGFRIGPSFTTVSSDDRYLDGSSMKTGLNVGFAAGFNIGYHAPLYLETGVYYTEKGGKGKADGQKFTYNLDYLEAPFVLKYVANAGGGLSFQPFVGGYVACGVGGKIKDFGSREAYSSFSDSPYSFQRFDAGLRMGCGVQYDLLYAEVGYDLGLANISHDDFEESRNSAFMLTVGVNFWRIAHFAG